MEFYLRLPFTFLMFWFYEAPLGMVKYFFSLNSAFLRLVSLTLLIKTYFKPWKNEYRQGLVGFSRGMGMFIKTFVIVSDLLLFLLLVIFEIAIVFAFILWPIGIVFFVVYA